MLGRKAEHRVGVSAKATQIVRESFILQFERLVSSVVWLEYLRIFNYL